MVNFNFGIVVVVFFNFGKFILINVLLGKEIMLIKMIRIIGILISVKYGKILIIVIIFILGKVIRSNDGKVFKKFIVLNC